MKWLRHSPSHLLLKLHIKMLAKKAGPNENQKATPSTCL